MLRTSLLLIAALPLAACGEGPGASVTVDAGSEGAGNAVGTDANGSLSIKVPGFDGALKLPPIKIQAENFDVNGLKLYPGSTIRDLHVDAKERLGSPDQGKVRIAFDAPAPLATVQAWFREKLATEDFVVVPEGEGFAGKTSEGEAFALSLEAEGEGKTRGQIEVGNQGLPPSL